MNSIFYSTDPWNFHMIFFQYRNLLFNVTMETFDGAEVWKLVGLYLLNKIKALLDSSNVGLYRDDGLAVVHKANGPKVDRLREDIISLKEWRSVYHNWYEPHRDRFFRFLLQLNIGKHFPFTKPNNTLLYIHPNPITHRQSLSNCHQWPTNAFQTYPMTKLSLTKLRLLTKRHLKTVDTKQHWISRNHPRIKDKIKVGKWSGSIHPSTQMLRQT